MPVAKEKPGSVERESGPFYFWGRFRRPWARPLQRLLTVHRCRCLDHGAQVSHVSRRIGERGRTSSARDGLQASIALKLQAQDDRSSEDGS
jgi:hypothetical protein